MLLALHNTLYRVIPQVTSGTICFPLYYREIRFNCGSVWEWTGKASGKVPQTFTFETKHEVIRLGKDGIDQEALKFHLPVINL